MGIPIERVPLFYHGYPVPQQPMSSELTRICFGLFAVVMLGICINFYIGSILRHFHGCKWNELLIKETNGFECELYLRDKYQHTECNRYELLTKESNGFKCTFDRHARYKYAGLHIITIHYDDYMLNRRHIYNWCEYHQQVLQVRVLDGCDIEGFWQEEFDGERLHIEVFGVPTPIFC